MSKSGSHGVLWVAGLLLLAGGIVAFVLGLWFFGSAATTPAAPLDPESTMGQVSNTVFVGVILLSIGAMITPVGGVMTGLAYLLDRQDRQRGDGGSASGG